MKYYQGLYNVINKEKYVGDKQPTFRSSWEKRFFYWCDNNINVLRWGSEVIKIKYFFEVDKKIHIYVVDFFVEIKNNDGVIEKWLVEIKPSKKGPVKRKDGTIYTPKQPKNNNRKALSNYAKEVIEYIKNSNKWAAAKKFCEGRNIKFIIITEEDLF